MGKRVIRRRVLSVLTAFALVCSGLSFSPAARPGIAKAAESEKTEEEYTPVTNVSELYAIRNNLSGKYRLMNDIDLTEATAEGGEVNNTGHGWTPIDGFKGVLDGSGHVIKGMKIYGAVSGNIGLFGKTDGANIQNLGMTDVNINVTASSDVNCGALVGYVHGGSINNCFVSGTIKVNGAGKARTGGFVGFGGWHFSINNSYNLADVISLDSTGEMYHGITAGLVGDTDYYSYAHICNSYNAANINNGQGYAISSSVDSYNSKNMFYLAGTGSGEVGTPLTEAQMKNANYFTGLDFDAVWEIDAYSTYKYPQLRSCRQKRVKSLTVETPPAKTEYNQGETLEFTDATLKVVYEDGHETVVFLTEDMLGEYDMMSIGKQQIPIYKQGISTAVEITINAIPVTDVKMGKSSTSIYKGYTEQLSASVWPENATDQSITWSSADETIAIVSQDGTVTGKKAGTTKIQATSTNGVTAECSVTITVPCARLILDKSEITINKGDTYVPGYKVSPVDSTDTVHWVSADDAIVHIDDENQLVGVSGGTTTVTGVAESGESALCTVTVMQELSEFTVLDIQDMQYTGSAITVTPTVTNGTKTLRAGVDYSLQYSSNTNVGTATVQITGLGCYQGTLTREFNIVRSPISSIRIAKAPDKTNYKTGEALDITGAVVGIEYENGGETEVPLTEDMIGEYDMTSAGTKKIPVRIEKAETFMEITVTEIEVTKVTISKESLTLAKGGQEKLTASVLPENAAHQGVTWSSTEEAVAAVSQDGTVTGKKAGTAKIRAKSKNGVTAECMVTVMQQLSECTVSEIKDVAYTGEALTPELTVKDGTKTLRVGVDYSLQYSSNTNVGTATVQITGLGCYQGTLTREFNIVRPPISSIRIAKVPDKTNYKTGEALDITGAVVGIEYENGEEEEIPLTEDMLGEYDMTSAGMKKIPVRIEEAETFMEITVTEIEVTKVTMSKESLILAKGGQEKLTASVLPENAAHQGITWSSTEEAVAAVSQDGTVTGKKAGTAKIRAKSENGVTAECMVTVMQQLSECTVSEIKDVAYTGEALTPELTVKDGTKTLCVGVDYSLQYSSNTNIGTAKVQITGLGCYQGILTCEFNIVRSPISSIRIAKAPDKTDYKPGEALDITGAVVGIEYENGEETEVPLTEDMLGEYDMTSAGTKKIPVRIEKAETFMEIMVTIRCTDLKLGESEITMDVGDTCMLDCEMLPEGAVDRVTWTSDDEMVVTFNEDNDLVGVGVGTAKITAAAESGATAECTVTVMQELSECTVLEIHDVTYTGAALTPALTVADGAKTLRVGEDYSLDYSSNVDVGTATVNITGMGFYKGTLTRKFCIVPAETSVEQNNNSPAQQENRSPDNESDEEYEGAVRPKQLQKVKIASIKASKKKVTIRWKQVANASGYKIEIAKNRAFTKGKKVYTAGKKTLKRTIKGMKKATYYIRIQAYAYSGDGQISYSGYSSVKKKKIK